MQQAVLARTRDKLTELEQRLVKLEAETSPDEAQAQLDDQAGQGHS